MLYDQISNDIAAAMKARDKVRLMALRSVKKYFIEAKTAPGANDELTDEAAIKILAKLAKQGRDTAVIYAQQSRQDLAEEELSVTLAMSLHAPTDEKRKKLMPIANKYSIAEIMDACRYYFDKTGRRLTFEYALTGGQNDSDEDAAELARLLAHLNCHVNLIPVNPVRERSFIRPNRTAVLAFQNKLENFGINVTIRREMGSDINGACGQLRKSYLGDSREIET